MTKTNRRSWWNYGTEKIFRNHLSIWSQNARIYAIANIRGGSERGENWHKAGRLYNKKITFGDFEFAAKYLVKQKYTVHEKIAIHGRSNGGLLVARCINKNFKFFGAAIAEVGVYDMIRYKKFPGGKYWLEEYGDLDKKEDFEYIYDYSPLHNIRKPTETQYPPTLILTTLDDYKVVPLHSLKFAATLQNAVKDNKNQTNPILLKVYEEGGHRDGNYYGVYEYADILTILYKVLDIGHHDKAIKAAKWLKYHFRF